MVLGQHAIGSTSFGSSGDALDWPLGSAAYVTVTTGDTTVEAVDNALVYWLRPKFVCPGYSSDGTNITIPIADLPGLTAAEANATTGDWREILQAIMTRSYDNNRVFIDMPLADQYESYKVFKKDLYGRTINSYFTFKFLTDMGEPNVAPEP